MPRLVRRPHGLVQRSEVVRLRAGLQFLGPYVSETEAIKVGLRKFGFVSPYVRWVAMEEDALMRIPGWRYE